MQDVQLKELVNILKSEYNIYQKICNLGENKKEIIIERNLIKLEEIVGKEQILLNKLEELENRRKDFIEEESVSELVQGVDSVYGQQLLKIKEELTELIIRVKEINDFNNRLIQDDLQLVNFNLSLLTDNSKQNTYGKKGVAENQENKSSILNHKA